MPGFTTPRQSGVSRRRTVQRPIPRTKSGCAGSTTTCSMAVWGSRPLPKKTIDYNLLRSRMEKFLSETEDTYAALMGHWVEETTSRRLGEIGCPHVSYISRVPQYDAYFRKDRLLGAYRLTLSGLGLDPASQKNIHIDTEER